MSLTPGRPWSALLVAALLAVAACADAPPANVLVTRIGEPGSKDAVQDCIVTELPGALARTTLWHDAGIVVTRTLEDDGAISVQVSAKDEVVARRSYDAAFVAGEQVDHFRVTAANRSFLLTFWAAASCLTPAPGEVGDVGRERPERSAP